MTEKEIYDLYVEHVWTRIPDYYQDEVDQCEKTILAGIKTIVDFAYERAAEAVAALEDDYTSPGVSYEYERAVAAIRALKV